MKATLDWSYDLLTKNEKILLRRVSVFGSSFDLAAAIGIMKSEWDDNACALDAVIGLAAKSLLVLERNEESQWYRLTNTTRAYALQKLDLHCERKIASLNHAIYFCGVLEQAKHAECFENRSKYCGSEIDAGLKWAFSDGGSETVGVRLAVGAVMDVKGLAMKECAKWVDQALAALAFGTLATSKLDPRQYQLLTTFRATYADCQGRLMVRRNAFLRPEVKISQPSPLLSILSTHGVLRVLRKEGLETRELEMEG